ncbi:non-specific serine,threonine protein kinase [Sarracenia purpurea var. burkii]
MLCFSSCSYGSTYLFNLVGQFVGCHALQDQCCCIISRLLQTYRGSPSKETAGVLGEQLQFLVSKLVGCCVQLVSNGDHVGTQSSQVLSLLNQLTVDSDPSLYDYIKELEPFPELDVFDGIRKFHLQLCKDYSPEEHLLKFVKRSCYLPPRLLLCSIKALHKKLLMGEIFQREGHTDDYWCYEPQIVQAVWTLVPMCGLDDGNSFMALVSDFISKVGIGDPHSVVFHLPGESGLRHDCPTLTADTATDLSFHMDTSISEGLLIELMRLLKKYVMDDSVKIIDMTSQTIRIFPNEPYHTGSQLCLQGSTSLSLFQTRVLDLDRGRLLSNLGPWDFQFRWAPFRLLLISIVVDSLEFGIVDLKAEENELTKGKKMK